MCFLGSQFLFGRRMSGMLRRVRKYNVLPSSEFLDLLSVCRLLGCCDMTVRRAVSRGLRPDAKRLRRGVRVWRREDVLRWAKENPIKQGRPPKKVQVNLTAKGVRKYVDARD